MEKAINEAQNKDYSGLEDLYIAVYKKDAKCACEIASNYIGPYRHSWSITKKLYQFRLNFEFLQKECVKFLLNNQDFVYADGVENAAEFHFEKKLSQLEQREKIMLIAIMESPSLYNPRRNPQGVENRILMIEQILKKNDDL